MAPTWWAFFSSTSLLSMNDLLTNQERQHAAVQGWHACHVYDVAAARWCVEVLPTNHPIASAVDAQTHVYQLARAGDKVAIRALQLVVQSHQRGATPPKRKKK